jgi:superfamily II DNA or RNA helicase
MMSFAIGSLVRARGREWVVLPESEENLLVLRPLGGTDDEVTGIYMPLETVEPASFGLPDPSMPGDYRSCKLLRDAVRLGFRSSAGPFRCFARIGVEPRPYQVVPLLMALKLDPIRLLIADDVGIGKTIEACLIARELIDRGEVRRMVVLCPPQLAEQWQGELSRKFHIDAELVLPSTASKLDRHCRVGQSIFEVFPFLIVSTDFIKSDRRRDDFLRACPEMVIIDEAHSCAYSGVGGRGRHQRHDLVKGLASNPDRHLILVTATPHSGNEETFRSLLAFLDPVFATLPEDLAGAENERHRRRLAAHLVQRRRGDLRRYLDADTPFPEREDREENYQLSPEYKKFFQHVLNYARETVMVEGDNKFRQRVRWWSALALLRSLASSPAAAAATLRSRASTADAASPEEADAIGRRTVLDLIEDESAEGMDIIPGSDAEDPQNEGAVNRRRLLEMARTADGLKGDGDGKLIKAVKLVKELLREGFNPILFCRFIPTAEYLAEELRRRLSSGVEVVAVTGTLPPADRELRVSQLAAAPKRVLVCTDCLSEGVNLQDHFDAVFHYDLSWNPTRHEQREGRADRYGQPSPKVRALTYYGTDNQIDGIVLDVLLRKHRTIRSSLGISVPVPVDTEQVVEAIFEGLLLRGKPGQREEQLMLFEDFFKPQREKLHRDWDAATNRDRRSRTMFAQESIKVEEVAQELRAARDAIGTYVDVAAFTKEALQACKGIISENGFVRFDLRETPKALRDTLGVPNIFQAKFELPVKDGTLYLTRTHPLVENLAGYVMDTALDPLAQGIARRCGVIRTGSVALRTTVLLVRYRFHIVTIKGGESIPLLAEDCRLLAFAGPPSAPQWLEDGAAERLLAVKPEGNIQPEQASIFVQKVIEGFPTLAPYLEKDAKNRGEELLAAHKRIRAAIKQTRVSYRVEPKLPPDILGIYIYLPVVL